VDGGAHLYWGDGDRLVFLANLDDWPHLYSVSLNGGAPLLLTPGAFMVEHVTESRDRRFMIYDANTGTTDGDDDRRHLFRVSVDRADPVTLTSGESLDWNPVAASEDRVAFVTAGARAPSEIGTVALRGGNRAALSAGSLPPDFPMADLVIPKSVAFRAADATLVHGQLFEREDSAAPKPGILFVHGGPVRQMMLGWHYMDFYCNAYAVNQYLAHHGFTVLSVNYRGGIGYGRQFQQPDRAGPAGAAEYQDVVAGAHFLQSTKGVDRRRIAIWGGSYGGYLTALALARNSDIFKAGVDLCGVHDWSRFPDYIEKPAVRYEQGDRDAAIRLAWESSPDAAVKGWKSPVLLIHGDDDRNVPFQQTIDLARRLDARHVSHEELVLPNEIHGLLRYGSWLAADQATVEFLARKLKSNGQ
jgi:dipeptidyl aminopeptidase/acylaminoacyl peptidase